jgi:hypothetical protein
MVRVNTSPAAGNGIGCSTSAKFAGFGAPFGRDFRMTDKRLIGQDNQKK